MSEYEFFPEDENPFSEDESFRGRLDAEWATLCAIREMLGISLKGTATPTYRQALDIGRVISRPLFNSDSSLLGGKDEPSLVKKYRQKAAGLTQLKGQPIEAVKLLDEDIDLNRELLNTDGDISQIKKELTSLENIRPFLAVKEYSENQLILRDLFKVERALPSPAVDGDTYRDFQLQDGRCLRIRLLHPDQPEHSMGADLIYETYWEEKKLVRIVVVQYKVWAGDTLYLSTAQNLKEQMDKMKNVFCSQGLCSPPETDKNRDRFRLQYCAAFLRPTDRLQAPYSRKITSGLHLPICRALHNLQKTPQGGDKLVRKQIRSESLSHTVFEEVFNTNMLGTRWLTYEQVEKLYREHKIIQPGEKIVLHAQEYSFNPQAAPF